MSWFAELFSTPFLPHKTCLILRPDLIWLHVISDGLITLAYLAIPITLLYFYRQRPQVESLLRKVLIYFSLFILACAMTHAMNMATMWWPAYYLQGVIKLGTALISLFTAYLLVLYMPRMLALRSPEELEAANRALAEESRQRREAAQALEKTVAQLSRSNRELEQFAHVAAHDLKSPLRAISSFSGLLEKRHAESLNDEGREFLAYVSTAAQRMTAMVDDLLRLARLENTETERKAAELDDCLRLAQANLRVDIAERSARITADPLPTLAIDASQVVLLLQNLLANAIKFCPPERQPEIRISATRRATDWAFCVEDNGIGIPPEHAEQVFGVFRRLHADRDYPGNGIGLSICRKIVELHGGRIWVEQEVAQGCAVCFTLPPATEDTAAAGGREALAQPASG